MGKQNYWDPKDYTIEDQLRDMIKGWDVSADDTSVIKEKDGYGRAFVASSSDKGHDRYDKHDGKWEKTH